MDEIKNYAYGKGTEADPYASADGTAGIQQRLDDIAERGGLVNLGCARYDISSTVIIDTPCVKLSGDVWGYSSDPNGVFESNFGTKLRLMGKDFPAISVGKSRTLGGNIISDIGIFGDCKGMDTRELYDKNNPKASAGLVFSSVRTDQCEFSKLSFCGLATAICAIEEAEIDACRFESINMDGCYMGVMYAPRASYYARFNKCIIADTPAYGIYISGKNECMHNIEFQDCHLVRNAGAFKKGAEPKKRAAVLFDGTEKCLFRNNLIDYAGVFWYYEQNDTENHQRQPSLVPTVSLWVCGNNNRILNNTVDNSSAESIVIEGDGNILMGNVVDSDVVISGKGNVVKDLVFTKEGAKLILKGEALGTTIISGVEEKRIAKK